MGKPSIGSRSKSNVQKVRQLVYDRDNNRCVASGFLAGAKGCQGRLTIQHSVARGMGGSAKYDAPVFLRAMCEYHNFLDSQDADFHDLCIDHGWSLPRWLVESTPTDLIPVRYIDGWHILVDTIRVKVSDDVADQLRREINGQ